MMKTNESMIDRVIRIVLGVGLLALGWTGTVTGVLGEIFKYLGVIPLLTGIIGWCPIYSLLRIRTKKA
jgi:hypothetical protein